MIDLQLPDPPREVLRRLGEFGADWHESKIPAELRDAGILGAAVEIQGPQFTMTVRAARRSPNLQLNGVVSATAGGGSRVTGALQLSTANQVLRVGGICVIGGLVWWSFGLLMALIASILLVAAFAGLSTVGGALGEREYQTLLDHAARVRAHTANKPIE